MPAGFGLLERFPGGRAQGEQRVPVAVQLRRLHLGVGAEVHRFGVFAAQRPVGFVGGVRHDRREQGDQELGDLAQRALGRAPARRIRAVAVEPVLDRVEVDRREVVVAEIENQQVGGAVLVAEIRFAHLFPQLGRPAEDPGVERGRRIMRGGSRFRRGRKGC